MPDNLHSRVETLGSDDGSSTWAEMAAAEAVGIAIIRARQEGRGGEVALALSDFALKLMNRLDWDTFLEEKYDGPVGEVVSVGIHK